MREIGVDPGGRKAPGFALSTPGVGAVLAVVIVCLMEPGVFRPQVTAQQQRDTPAGTAVISGKVLIAGDTNQPARRVRVTLNEVARLVPGQATTTDETGAFTFSSLPAGRFELKAIKDAWLSSSFGAARPDRPGTPIVVKDGDRITRLTMTIARGGVITGAVRDGRGRPVPTISVRVMRLGYNAVTGERTLVTLTAGTGVTTDDRGEYRAYGLPPGNYLVLANPLPAGGLPPGWIVPDIRPLTAADVQQALQGTRASANAPGAGATTTAPASLPRVNYAPVFHPGVTDIGTATTVALGLSEERTGVDVTMQYVPTARIEGTLIDVNGQLIPDATALLVPVGGSINDVAAYDLGIMASAGQSGGSGRFSIGGVAPGRYQVQARSGGANQPRWGQLDIAVDGQDQSGLTVTLHPGAVVSGTMTFAGMSVPPENLGGIRPMLNRTQTQQAMIALGPTSTVQPDRTFTMTNVMPGSYNLRVSATPAGVAGAPGWSLKSAMVQGRDVADVPLLIGPGEAVAEVVITFTDQPTEISGTLLDAAGRPNSAYSIVVFSTDRRFWLQTSRRTQAVRPATNGTFKIAGLPAGDYLLTAVTDYDPTDLYDPSFLEQLQAAAYKLTLADGEKKKQDLKLAGR